MGLTGRDVTLLLTNILVTFKLLMLINYVIYSHRRPCPAGDTAEISNANGRESELVQL